MKILTTLALTTLLSTLAFSQTTMCFKENHKNMSTIETAKLSGGECNNIKSVKDMKNEGWDVDDIKINGSNYIYIFKKENISSAAVDMDALETQILQRLEVRKNETERKRKVEIKYNMSISGKKLYIKKCQTCHGDKGEKEVGTSRAINSIGLSDFKTTIRDYVLGTYDRGAAFQMRPYANLMSEKDATNVYIYLKSLKPKKIEKVEKK